MEKIEKVLKALDKQAGQYAEMAKDEALQALIGPAKDKEKTELTAKSWYTRHNATLESIRTVKSNYK